MKKKATYFTSKWIVLFIMYAFLIQSFIIPVKLAEYRFTENYFYVYKYGNVISRILVYIAFLLSVSYPLVIWLKEKKKCKENWIFLFLGTLPVLYYLLFFLLIFIVKIFRGQ